MIGRVVQIDREPHTIIGVLPERFRFPQVAGRKVGWSGVATPDIFRPKLFSEDERNDKIGRHNYGALARLKPGISIAQAEAELDLMASQILKEAGVTDLILRGVAFPLQEAMVGDSRRGLIVLFAAVTSVLLIGCLNLANFLLAQAERRKHEAALRQALGATRLQIIRQGLSEALLVSLGGGALGVVFAQVGLGILLSHAPANLPRLQEVHLDLAVLAFALLLSVLSGLLVGFVPAWRLSRSDPQAALASGARSIACAESRRFSEVLVARKWD